MLCGYLPFDEEGKKILYKKILRCDFEIPDFVSPEARHLLNHILVRDPGERYSVSDMKRHVWMNVTKRSYFTTGVDPTIMVFPVGKTFKFLNF